MNEQLPDDTERSAPLPLYQLPEVMQKAEEDSQLAERLRALELADKGREISTRLHQQLEQATRDYLERQYPDMISGDPPSEIG